MIKALTETDENEQHTVDPTFGRSFNLRLLIHYLGDVHQPLHTADRYTLDFPNGDQGGNLFFLKPIEHGINELHALWDSVVNKFPKDLKLVRTIVCE